MKRKATKWILILILLCSCKFTYEDDKLSQMATAFNLAKPLAEAEARIVIQCDADTPTGVKSLRGTVMDYDSGSPIQNAFASSQVSTEVYVTDTEGKFKIQKVGIETDTVILKVFADNYKSLSHPVQFICQNIHALIYLLQKYQKLVSVKKKFSKTRVYRKNCHQRSGLGVVAEFEKLSARYESLVKLNS